MLKRSTALTFVFYFSTHTFSFGMEHQKSLWNPETVIGVGGGLVSIKLIHDGLQKMFNPNKQSLSVFGDGQGSKTTTINVPQATSIPKTITLRLEPLNAEETASEYRKGIVLFGFGCVGTLASIYWIQKN